MKIDIMTLFPEMINAVMRESIIGRAQDKGVVEVKATNIRDYALDKHHKADDAPYGGGRGQVMLAEPLYLCHQALSAGEHVHTVFLSAQGQPFNQQKARELLAKEHFILVCGHYEGIDQRFIDECVDEEISIGDFVLTGGEIPAMAVADAVCRMVPGVLPDEEAFTAESHWDGLLEHPQYTRPEIWHDRAVPAVLLTGAHDAVAKWQEETALEVTRRKRPDMLYDHRVNGEPYARYIRVFVPHKEREYDIVAFMKMIFHRRILTNREQKILKRMMPVLDSLPTPPECEENSRIWLNAKNAGRILDMYAPLFDMLREHGIDYRIEYSDTPDGKPVAENDNFTVFA